MFYLWPTPVLELIQTHKLMMKLQLALDGTLEDSLRIFRQVHPFIDLIELGTPLIYREGVSVAAHFREIAPAMPIVADFKIMDAGEHEAIIAFKAGCDFVTVLGVTQDATLMGAVKAARDFGKQVIVDMLQVTHLLPRAEQVLEMGCHFLCIHTAHDLQSSSSPLETLRLLRSAMPDAPLAVAGGINLTTLDRIIPLMPQMIIVGGAITQADDPVQVAAALRERITR